jgi:polysaccharide chain length determinant protein (PEP-CTERM system associated)
MNTGRQTAGGIAAREIGSVRQRVEQSQGRETAQLPAEQPLGRTRSMSDLKALLAFYIRSLWRRRWGILALTWIGCIIGWMAVSSLPDSYTAKAKVMVDADRLLAPLLRDIMGQTDSDQQMLAMQADLRSKAALQSVARKAEIVVGTATEAEENGTAINLARRVRVLISDRNAFDISYEDKDPWLAQRVVQSFVDTLVNRNLASARRETEKALGFIDTQIQGYEERLRQAEERLADFQRQHGGEFATSQGSSRRLEELTSELQQTEAERKAKEWQRDRIRVELQRAPEWISEAQVAAGGGMSPLQARLEQLREQYDALTKRYTDKHPDVATLMAQILEIESRFLAEAKAGVRAPASSGGRRIANATYQRLQQDLLSVEAQIIAAQRRGEAIEASIANLRAMSSEIPDIEAQLAQLNRDYSIVRGSYGKLIERREALSLAQNMAGQKAAIVFQIVEPPQLPTVPSGPDRPLLFLAVAAASVAAGLGYGLVRILIAGTGLGTIDAVRTISGYPVLGAVSIVRRHEPARTAASFCAFVTLALALATILGGLIYSHLYQISPSPPNLAGLMQTMPAQLSRLF